MAKHIIMIAMNTYKASLHAAARSTVLFILLCYPSLVGFKCGNFGSYYPYRYTITVQKDAIYIESAHRYTLKSSTWY